MRRAEDGDAAHFATIQELAGDEQRLDGLSSAHVIRYQQSDGIQTERHQQRHELVRTRLDRDAAKRAERARAGSNGESQGVPEKTPGLVIAQISDWVRWRKCGRFHGLEGSVDPGDLVIGSTQRTHDEQLVSRFREHDPLSAASADEATDGETHVLLPKMLGFAANRAGQASGLSGKRST